MDKKGGKLLLGLLRMSHEALKQAIYSNDKGKAMALLQQNNSLLNKHCVLAFLPPYLLFC